MAVTVTVTLPSATMTVGQAQQAKVRVDGIEESDGLLDARPITYASSLVRVATVSSSGMVRAVAPGSAQIRATVEGQTGAASVAVAAPVIAITAAQETALNGVPLGGLFTLRGPTLEISGRRDA